MSNYWNQSLGLLFVAFCVCSLGCSSSLNDGGGDGVCPYSNPDPDTTKKYHGEPCESDDECAYGLCHLSPSIAPFKFCTKVCDCGPNSQCSDDSTVSGQAYTCQRYTLTYHPDESLRAICLPSCQGSSCPSDQYTACDDVENASPVKVCLAP